MKGFSKSLPLLIVSPLLLLMSKQSLKVASYLFNTRFDTLLSGYLLNHSVYRLAYSLRVYSLEPDYWDQISVLQLNSCVSLDKFLNSSGLQFPHL